MNKSKKSKINKFIIAFLVSGILILSGLIFLPIFFKDTAKTQVTKLAAQYVNAEVKFDELDVSLFSHFPELSVNLGNLQIIGKDKFAGEKLVQVESFDIALNIFSILGSSPEVKSIYLKKPEVTVKVLKDGSANYDIYIEQPEEEEADPTATEEGMQLALNKWVIEEGSVSYEDESLQAFAYLENIQHEGSGELDADLFDLITETVIEKISVDYEGTKYLNKQKLDADVTLNMDMDKMKFVFKENEAKLNDFTLSFEGFFQMLEEDYKMDIKFAAPQSGFKSLLSLIPPEFIPADVETDGKLAFNGFVKGVYNEKQLPGFDVKLKVNEARFKYPDLPTAITDINVDMEVVNQDGNLDNTVIDIRAFDMDLGQNPVHGRVKIKGLTDYLINADVKAKLDLADVGGMYPLDSMGLKELKGKFDMVLKANGVYSESKNTIPKIDATMTLAKGFVRPLDYDLAMEDITVNAKAKNTTGKMADLRVDLSSVSFTMDKQPFQVEGHVYDLDNLTYDFKAKGKLDLEKIMHIYPIDGMKMSGTIDADIQTKGKMSSIEAERYDELPTSGQIKMQNFLFNSTDLPQGMRIRTADLVFTPQAMQLKQFDGDLGKSDMQLTGQLTNYLAYGLKMAGLKKGDEVIRGNMTLKSKKFDLNEWMTDTEETTETTEESEYGVIEVPKDIDFTFDAEIQEVLYEKSTMTDINGLIVIRNGVVRMDNLNLHTAGGKLTTSGSYNTQDINNPLFDFDFKIGDMKIAKAIAEFSTIETFAPIAKQMEGLFNTNFKLNGKLQPDLMPDFASLSGSGLVTLTEATFNQNNQLMSGITQFTGLNKLSNTKLKDVILVAKIQDGKLNIDPVDIKLGDLPINISGFTSLDGKVDFDIKLDVPKEQVAGKLNSWFGIKPDLITNETIELFLQVKGDYNSPKIGLDPEKTKNYVETEVKSRLKKEAGSFLKGLLDKNKDKVLGKEEEEETQTSDSTQVQQDSTSNGGN